MRPDGPRLGDKKGGLVAVSFVFAAGMLACTLID